MAGFSDYAEAAVLNHVFGSTAFTKPASLYIALFTASPSDSGGGTEVSGGGYVRKAATFTVSGTSPASAALAAQIDWNAATADWGTVSAAAVFDAASGGNMLAYGSLSVPKTIGTNDVFRLPAGGFTITLD